MDSRKLIQHGASSLTVSLPSKWLKTRNLKKGDSLYLEEEGSKIILSTYKSLSVEKISVDVSSLDRTSILLYIQSLYKFGYNEVEIKFKKPTTMHYRTKKEVSISSLIHFVVNRTVGFEVIEQSKDRMLIKHLTNEGKDDFKQVLRRVFLLLNETADSLLEGITNNDEILLNSVEEKHDNVTKFVSYCLRLLNKHGYPDVKKTCFYFHVIASLDKIMDVIKYSAREILDHNLKFNKETLEVWKGINKSLKLYYELFYKFDLKKVDALGENRDHTKFLLKSHIKKISSEELLQLTSMKQILEIILDLTDSRLGLEY